MFSTGLGDALLPFFLKPFNVPEFHRFGFSNGDVTLNAIYHFAKSVFENHDTLHESSAHIAQHLFELSDHPNIKAGDVFIALFENVVFNNTSTTALGIFKSESKQPFLDIHEHGSGLDVSLLQGIHLEKLDKGCLIIHAAAQDGFRVLSVDHTNRGQNANFWTEQFLRIIPCNDSFQHTKALLQDTRQFLAEAIPDAVGLEKSKQAEILNRSVGYMKEHEQFNPVEYEEEVFKEAGLVDAYRNFVKTKQPDQNAGFAEEGFPLSDAAVKKYGKVYKSVLKLDKNFHVYIHGDRNLIEKGREADGRKYYKLYYEEEQ